jgi:Glycosyltransferase like family 2/Glycosyltransferase family 9 (heptosyltransferase)
MPIDKTKFPPGGWRFHEPATRWKIPNPTELSFDGAVQAIINHRRANPQFNLTTDFGQVSVELENFTCARPECSNYCAGQGALAMPPAEKKSPVGAVRAVVDRLRNDARGALTLATWALSDGFRPVKRDVAIARAKVCNGCPQNVQGRNFEGRIAEFIRREEVTRGQMNLFLPNEDRLGTCAVCNCYLKLKVFTPLAHLDTNKETLDKLPQNCWIVREATSRTVNVVRDAAFGDVIQATTVADSLAEAGYKVHFLCNEHVRPMLQGHPSIYSFERSPYGIDIEPSYEVDPNYPKKHVLDIFMENVPSLRHRRVPTLALTQAEKDAAAHALSGFARPIVGVAANSGSWRNKQTIPDQWGVIAKRVDATFVNLGPWPLPDPVKSVDANGFRKVMALISQCDVIAAVDTGPMHVAVALRKPMVLIEGPFPYNQRITDGSDYVAVKAPVSCVGCYKATCPIDAVNPPCRNMDVDGVVSALSDKVKPLGVSALIPTMGKGDYKRAQAAVDSSADECLIGVDGDFQTDYSGAKVRVIPNPGFARNGYGKNSNRMARLSKGRFLLFLNDDCYMNPGAIELMLEQMADPKVAVVGALLWYPNGTIQHGGGLRNQGGANFGHRDHLGTRPSITSPKELEFVTFAAALVRRKAFFDVGGFDERYDCYCEDADICVRFREAGWKVMYDPRAQGVHDESRTTSPMKQQLLDASAGKFDSRWRSKFTNEPPIP